MIKVYIQVIMLRRYSHKVALMLTLTSVFMLIDLWNTTVKSLIETGSRIYAGSLIQAGSRSNLDKCLDYGPKLVQRRSCN